MKKLSIVTINYNNASGLRQTLASVLDQSYKDFDYIVIDGGSKDESVEEIRKVEGSLHYWKSEPDKGIIDAINKGIKIAATEYIMFINSGDVLYDNGCLEALMAGGLSADITYSDLNVITAVSDYIKTYPKELTFSYFLKDTIAHPGCVFRKELFDELGDYDRDLVVVSDWKWFLLAICRHNVSYKHSGIVMASFRLDGLSSKPESQALIARERRETVETFFPAFVADYDRLLFFDRQVSDLAASRVLKMLNAVGLAQPLVQIRSFIKRG